MELQLAAMKLAAMAVMELVAMLGAGDHASRGMNMGRVADSAGRRV